MCYLRTRRQVFVFSPLPPLLSEPGSLSVAIRMFLLPSQRAGAGSPSLRPLGPTRASPPQAVTPCRSASAALPPGTGSDTTGSSALTIVGCTSHHASPSLAPGPGGPLLRCGCPPPLRVDGDLGFGGSQSSLGHFTCWRISRQRGTAPFSMPVPVPNITQPRSPGFTSHQQTHSDVLWVCGPEPHPALWF